MTFFHWILFLISGFLYAAPVLASTYTWPLVFAFPIPLFYVMLYNNLSGLYGFLWGIIAFSTHLSGVLLGMDTFAQGSVIARFAPTLLIVSYASLFPCIWFAINYQLIKHDMIKTMEQRLILWAVTYWFFIIVMEEYCLCIFSRCEGYFLFNPIFILAEKIQLLTLLPYLGKGVLTFLLLCLSASIVYAFVKQSTQSYILLTIFTLPWLISLALPIPKTQAPSWLSKIAPLSIIIPHMINLNKQAVIAQEYLKTTAEQYPNAELIIMPESSFQCNHLSTTPAMCEMWSEKELGRPLNIIMGSWRFKGPLNMNTLHWCYNGKLIKLFDKRHAMLIIEQIPPMFKLKVLEELFFSKFPGVTASTEPRPQFDVLQEVSFIPYICSELFFNDQPDDIYPKGSTILATTNDNWCQNTNIAYLMRLAGRFRSIQWERNILYISFLYATYYDIYGNEFTLETKE